MDLLGDSFAGETLLRGVQRVVVEIENPVGDDDLLDKRENFLLNRLCSCSAPHWPKEASQDVGSSPAEPATGRG